MTHLDEFVAARPFALDLFQVEGCEAVESGRGVLVCAPTGAGKTVVGEFAVYLALAHGTKCFYTTPIKALSNQKYHDLVDEHGEEMVGLLTADVSINPHAEIVVMTTEVLRNMIYADSADLQRLEFVVMDEIHYLADRERGAVWEEIILNLHESVRVIGLSATVSNSEEFGDWLSTVRGFTDVIVSEHRPVPLDQWMLVGRKIYPLFEPGEPSVNNALMHRIYRMDADDHYRPIGRPDVLKVLQADNMLPAITFIFSRAGCDQAVIQCQRARLNLTTEQEAAEIKAIVDKGVEGIPDEDLEVLRFRQWRAALSKGYAAHHAGMLPAFRHIVEELFVKGLLHAVFATETLALGINMPARTVVLERLVKFNGEAHVDLTPGQYTQLMGRAGRRGIDTMGNAVVLWAPAVDPEAVAGLASTRTYPLISTFEPSYNMAINLLGMNGYDDSVRLIEKSFAQYQADGSIVSEAREIERIENSVETLRAQLHEEFEHFAVPGDLDELVEYAKLRRDLSRAEKEAKRVAKDNLAAEIVAVLGKLQVGEVIAMPGKKKPILGVVITPANQASDPRPWITTEQGWSGRIDAAGFRAAPMVIGTMPLPKSVRQHPRKNVRYVVDKFRKSFYDRPKRIKVRNRETAEIRAARDAMRAHPADHWPELEREILLRTAQELEREQAKLDAHREKVFRAKGSLGQTFAHIIDLLTEYDYVENRRVTEEGERLSLLHNSADLLVAQCLKRGIWDGLDPAELAGVVSMCSFENRKATGGDVEVPTDPMVDAMNGTMRVWTELTSDERRHRLPPTRMPESQFALALHQWTAGAPLGYCLAAAAQSGAELTPGDFVRSCLQAIDLLEQVAKTAYDNDTKRSARRSIDAIRRGVVAIGN